MGGVKYQCERTTTAVPTAATADHRNHHDDDM
jgi:hypothetical protein